MNNSQHSNRILITSGIFPPDIGGPATYAELLANELNVRGFNVCVLTYSKQFFCSQHSHDNSHYSHRFKIIRVWSKWPKGIKHLIFGIKLLGLARKYDIIYALNVWSAGLPSLIVSKIFKKKFIIRIVGDYAWEVGVGKSKVSILIDDFQNSKKSGWVSILFKLQGWICKKADTVIVPSKYLAGIVRGWGIPEAKIKIIYKHSVCAGLYL